jgi:hypothetical protein
MFTTFRCHFRTSLFTQVGNFSLLVVVFLFVGSWMMNSAAIAQPPGSGGPPPGAGDPPSESGYEEDMSMEMNTDIGYESGEYGMDPYGNGGMTTGANISGAIDGGLSQSLSQFDFVSLLAPTVGAKMPTGPILLGQAGEAFSMGHQELAMNLYYGHMVAEFEEAGPAFKAIKYSAILRRPVWQVRWGVSISTKLDGVTEPKPMTATSVPGANGFDGTGFDTGGMPENYDPSLDEGLMDPRRGGRPPMGNAVPIEPEIKAGESLEANLGLVATMFAEQFSSRFQSGAFGAALPTLAPPPVEVPAADLAAANNAGFEDMGYDDAMLGMNEEGMDGQGMGPGGPPKPVEPPPSLAPAPLSPGSNSLPLWVPGIVFVGEGQSTATLETAKEAGIDLLVHFDVIAKARGTETQNISRCRIFQVSTGKVLIASKGMDSMEAMQLVRAGRGTNSDYVTEQMLTVWAIVDKQMSVVAFPQITPEIAKKRVGMLVTSPTKDRLQTLAEIRMYEAGKLLTPEDVSLAFDLVAGDDAMELLYGPVNDRRELVRTWATE